MEVLRAAGFPVDGVGADLMRNRVSVTLSTAITPADLEAMARGISEEAGLPLDMVCVEAAFPDEVPEPVQAGTQLEVIVLPDDAGNHPPDTPVQCGNVRFLLGALAALQPIEAVDPDLRAVLEGWLSNPEGSLGPGWLGAAVPR